MTKTRIIGDIHGRWYDYQMMTNIKHPSVQVGDFGIGFNGSYWEDRVNDHQADGQHRFIRGNHDNPATCKTAMVGCIADGTIEDDVMYIGGAWSIDWQWRTEGIDWWRDEELSYRELDALIDLYEQNKPRVMITHDCPTLVAYHMFIKENKGLGDRTLRLSRTGEAFQSMFELHQPDEWYFGHWHHTLSMNINGTKFQCLGECDFVDVDI